MKTTTKIFLGVAAAGAVGAYAYRMGVNNVQFSLDGYQPAPDGAGLLMRIKATNTNKLFGYPVPRMLVNVFDSNSNFLGTAINTQLQYIPANGTSFIYAVVQPNYANLVSVITGIITNGTLPTNLIFNGLVKVGPVEIPFDTGASIGSTNAAIGFMVTRSSDHEANGATYKAIQLEHGKLQYYFMQVTGRFNYISIKNMKNPWAGAGKYFKNWDDAARNYKNPTLKAMILLAEDALNKNKVSGYKENFLLATSLTPWPIL